MPTPGGVSSGFVVGTSEAMSPTGLAYLTMPLSGIVLDDTDARLAEDVAEDAHDLEALADAGHGIADAALLDPHLREPRERGLVGDRPSDGLAQAVDLLLRGALELAQCGTAAGHERIDGGRLLRGDRSHRHVSHLSQFPMSASHYCVPRAKPVTASAQVSRRRVRVPT